MRVSKGVVMQATMQRGWPMREIKVKRDELLVKVRANREKHIAEYKEACEGYKAAATQKISEAAHELTGRIERLKEGQMISLMLISFDLEVPQDHTDDYDQVIAMLEMSVDDVMTIRSDEFACYVMDNWQWRREWEVTKSTYNAGNARR